VQKQGQEVQANTFRGAVVMKKDHYAQKLKANEHLSFSFRKRSFLGKRKLNTQEMGRYHTWNAKLGGFQQKTGERRKLMNSLNQLSPEEKSKVLSKMKQAPPRQRLKALRRAVNKERASEPGAAAPRSASPLNHPRGHSPQGKPLQRQAPQAKTFKGRMTQGQTRGGRNKKNQDGKNNGHSPMIKNNGTAKGKGGQVKPKPLARHPQGGSPNTPHHRGPKMEFHVQHPQKTQTPAHSRPAQKPKKKTADSGTGSQNQR
jgi:hypothetical protein